MPTIKQLADELGMTKQGIRRYLEQLPAEYAQKDSKGVVQISSSAARKIRELVEQKRKPVTGNKPVTEPVTVPGEVTTLIAMLQKELDTKNATIESQSRQLEQAHQSIQDLTAALQSAQLSAQQAQALHAGTLHKQLKEGEPEQSVVVEQADQSAPEPEQPHRTEPEPAPEQQPEKKAGLLSRLFGKK